MTSTDTAPSTPVTVHGVLDDPEQAWRLCQANGPYAHVLMLREFAASLDAYREAARRGSPEAVGVLVDDELMTMPIYRGDWVSSREVHIDGVDEVLHNERLIEAAAHGVRRRGRATAHRVLQPHRTDAAEPQAHRRPHVPGCRTVAVPGVGGQRDGRVGAVRTVAGEGRDRGRLVLRRSERRLQLLARTAATRPRSPSSRRRTPRWSATTTSCTTGSRRWATVASPWCRSTRCSRTTLAPSGGGSPRATATSASSVATTSASASRGRPSASVTPTKRARSTSTSTTSASPRCSSSGATTASPGASCCRRRADPLGDPAFAAAIADAYAGPLSTA